MFFRALGAALLGGSVFLLFVVPAGWVQAGQLQLVLPGDGQNLLEIQPFSDIAAQLHAGNVFMALAALAYVWLAIIPTLRVFIADRSRGTAFMLLLGGATLLCLIAVPPSIIDMALAGKPEGLIRIAAVAFFAVGLSFYLIGESPFVSFGYLAWALLAHLASIDLAKRILADPALAETWLSIAGMHAAGASVLLSVFALLETRAHLWRARGSRIASALLALILCSSAAIMVLYQYRLGVSAVSPNAVDLTETSRNDMMRAGAASFTLLAAFVVGVIRHALLMSKARRKPDPVDQPSTS